jgi:hypothetical protein
MFAEQGMEELIQQAFLHVEGLGNHVAEGHYDLLGPHGEIILPLVWEDMIQPGWSLTMHMWPLPEVSLKPAAPPPPASSRPDFAPPSLFASAASDTTKIGSEWVPPPRGVPPPPPPNWRSQSPPPNLFGRVPGSVDPSKPSVEKDKLLFKTFKPSAAKERKKSHEKKQERDTDNPVSEVADYLSGRADQEPNKKEERKILVNLSKADTESLVSDSLVSDEDIEQEAARKLIKKLVRHRKIYRVGKMNRGKYHDTYQISPKKEGLLLLNEYGRKLIDEVMKAKV